MKRYISFVLFFLLATSVLVACTKQAPTAQNVVVSGETSAQNYSSPITHTVYGSGKHVVQLYADFQCPACINFSHSILPIIEDAATKGQTQIQFKQYPLKQIHKNAYRDSLAALCADEAGKYGAYKIGLYALEEKKAGATVTDADRIALASSAGIADIATFTSCLSSDKFKSQVDKDMAEGDGLGIEGTPTVFLDGKRLDLGMIFADFAKGKAFLERILAE